MHQDQYTNSPDWSPCAFFFGGGGVGGGRGKQLREFVKRSKHFSFSDHFINSS